MFRCHEKILLQLLYSDIYFLWKYVLCNCHDDIFFISGGNQKVCVVGIIGRCHLFQKDHAMNQLVDHNVYKVFFFFPSPNLTKRDSFKLLQCHFTMPQKCYKVSMMEL